MSNQDFNINPTWPPRGPAGGASGDFSPDPAPQDQPRPPLPAVNPAAQPPPPNIPSNVAPFTGPAVNQPIGTKPDAGWEAPVYPPSVYIPPAPNRPPSQLGQPWWPVQAASTYPGQAPSGADMPTPQESYRYMREGAQRLSMWSAPSVSGPAGRVSEAAAGLAPFIDAVTRGRFSQAYSHANKLQVEKQLGRLQIQREMMLNEAERLQTAHSALLLQYGSVFKAADLGAISPEEAEEQIRDIATIHQDPVLGILNNKGLRAAGEFLMWQDAEMRKIWASTTSLRKATQSDKAQADEEVATEWGETPLPGTTGVGGAAGGGIRFPLPGERQVAGPAEAAVSPEGEALPEEPGSQFDKVLKQHGYTPQQIEAVHQAYDGDPSTALANLQKMNGPNARMVKAKIGQGVMGLTHAVNSVAQGQGSADDKMDQIEQISPGTAHKLRGLLDLSLDPEKDIPATGKERERLTTLAHAINPNWRTNSYRLKEQYEKLNQPAVRTVQRVGAFTSAVNSLNSALLQIPEDQKVATNVLKSVYNRTWSGNPAYQEIYTAIQNVINETSAIQSGTGQSRVTNVKMRAQEMLNTMSPAQIRTQLLIDAQANYGMIRGIAAQYKQTIGDPNAQLPFFSRQTQQDYKAIMRSNPYTGEMPEDASGAVRATSKKGGSKPSWLNNDPKSSGFQGWKPLTEAQVVEGRRQIRQNQDSTDPKVQAAIQGIRRRLGEFATAEPGDPDYAEQEQR